MKAIAILCLFAMTGCADIYSHEIRKIVAECGGAENVSVVSVDFGIVSAKCADGTKVSPVTIRGG